MVRAESLSIADLKGEWTGTLVQFSHEIEGAFPVKMTVASITGNEFTGTMDWPTFNGCKTEIRGMLDGNVIRWTEIAYLEGDDVVLNGLYVARFKTKSKIVGEWMDPKHTIFPKGPKYGVTGATLVLTKK
jgi:hypothetical protein